MVGSGKRRYLPSHPWPFPFKGSLIDPISVRKMRVKKMENARKRINIAAIIEELAIPRKFKKTPIRPAKKYQANHKIVKVHWNIQKYHNILIDGDPEQIQQILDKFCKRHNCKFAKIYPNSVQHIIIENRMIRIVYTTRQWKILTKKEQDSVLEGIPCGPIDPSREMYRGYKINQIWPMTIVKNVCNFIRMINAVK